MKKTTFAFALAVVLPAAGAFAQKQTPPAPGPTKDFQLPAPVEFKLDNGLEVSLVPYGTVPKVRVELAILAGNAYESAKQTWLADLTGDLMREGTTTKTASQISEAAARMGGSLDVNVSVNAAEISGDVLSEFGPEMARLVADVARNPKFPESELSRLKADSARELSIIRSQPQQMALEKFRGLLYADHPYGRIFPTPEMIQGFTIADVRNFYDANYGAGRAHLYVAGRFDRAAMEAAIREAFGGWKAGKPSTLAAPQPKTARAVHLVDRPGAVQSTILLGMPVIDPSNPDYVPLSVVNTLLGGYFSSRITANIRESKGYTYSPSSQLSTRYRDAYWAEAADVTTNVTGPSLKEIFYEIDRLQAEPPTAAELKAAQNYMAGVFVLQNSSRSGIINVLELVDLHGLPADYLKSYVKQVYAVTPQDVQRLAQKYIQDDKATIVVVGDRKVIEEQVKPYGTIAP
ncbi:MAG TPA: pitrilysin family protein [Thermoanaerobaculia bacterium]|nr:pitrilysin family protein [Thermoanaerobaculia bacterium]